MYKNLVDGQLIGMAIAMHGLDTILSVYINTTPRHTFEWVIVLIVVFFLNGSFFFNEIVVLVVVLLLVGLVLSVYVCIF